MPNYTTSVWSQAAPSRRRPALQTNGESSARGGPGRGGMDGDLVDVADVAIIGGGITGITAARLLCRAGLSVVVLESRRIGKGETDKSTAHLTEVLDTRYHRLVSTFGLEPTRLAARAQRDAIACIARFVEDDAIDCAFQRAPGFLYAEAAGDLEALREEAEAARRLGLDAELTADVPLPFPVAGGIRFDGQAQLHPRAYLHGLAAGLRGDRCAVFEQTHVLDVEEGAPCRVVTDHGVVRAHDVIVAAHVPISNRFLLHSKLAAYRTYAVAVQIPVRDPIGLFWDTADPYHYIRSASSGGATFLIVGGEDHKVGEADDTAAPFGRLEDYVRQRFGIVVAPTDFRWSGQIVVSVDGLPYIGRNALSSRVFVATGFGGNGITQGTLAAMLLCDEVRGVPSVYGDLFDATRIKPLASARAFIAENADYPKHLLQDRLSRLHHPGPRALDEIQPGEGQVLAVRGQRLAVYRNANGALSALAPACTHLGCLVHWNTTEKSWDCPCHGSRFDPQGRVLNGPAVTPLAACALPPSSDDDQVEADLDDGVSA